MVSCHWHYKNIMYFIENTLSRNASRCFTFSARDREIVHRRLKVIRLVLLFFVWCGNCNRNVAEFKCECRLGVQGAVSCKLLSRPFYDPFWQFSQISPNLSMRSVARMKCVWSRLVKVWSMIDFMPGSATGPALGFEDVWRVLSMSSLSSRKFSIAFKKCFLRPLRS